jgi:hypothetical protein
MEEKDRAIVKLQAEFDDRMEEKDRAIVKLQAEFDDRTQWALRLDAELQQARSKLEAIKQSKLYKLARSLGFKLQSR